MAAVCMCEGLSEVAYKMAVVKKELFLGENKVLMGFLLL